MGSLNPKVALYGSHNECSRTDIVFLSLSEVGNVAVSLREWRRGKGDGGYSWGDHGIGSEQSNVVCCNN